MTPTGKPQAGSPRESEFGLADWQLLAPLAAETWQPAVGVAMTELGGDDSPRSVADSDFGLASWQLHLARSEEAALAHLPRLPPPPLAPPSGAPHVRALLPDGGPPRGGELLDQCRPPVPAPLAVAAAPRLPTALPRVPGVVKQQQQLRSRDQAGQVELWRNKAVRMAEAAANVGARGATWALKWDTFREWHRLLAQVEGRL